MTNPKTLKQLIKAGKFDHTYVDSDYQLPKDTKARDSFELIQEANLTIQQLWDKYGTQLASVREVLEYAVQNWDGRTFIIGIEKQGNQFWYACLSRVGLERGLDVCRGDPDGQWLGGYRFLRYKSSDSGTLGSQPLGSLPDELIINNITYVRKSSQ